MKKTGKYTGWILGAAVLAVVTGSAVAYFTDTEQAVNHMTVGKVDITLTEPKWDALPDKEKQDLTPLKQLVKDPRVTNVGINDAFVFVTADVPVADIITANADGTKNPKAVTELFSWTVNNGWTQLGNHTDVKDSNNVVTAHRYTYVYGSETACTPLVKGVTTAELFGSVRFANVIEGEFLPDGTAMEEASLDISLNAYAIQTENLTENSLKDPENVWKIFKNQNEL